MIGLPYGEQKLWRYVKPFSSNTGALLTDRRTDRIALSISRVSMLTRDKNYAFLSEPVRSSHRLTTHCFLSFSVYFGLAKAERYADFHFLGRTQTDSYHHTLTVTKPLINVSSKFCILNRVTEKFYLFRSLHGFSSYTWLQLRTPGSAFFRFCRASGCWRAILILYSNSVRLSVRHVPVLYQNVS